MLVGLPMLVLMFFILYKLILVLGAGELPNNGLSRTVIPILWVVFFVGSAFYIGRAVSDQFKLVPYDFTSLIPFGCFAVVDFVFAARLRRTNQWYPQDRRLSPWFDIP